MFRRRCCRAQKAFLLRKSKTRKLNSFSRTCSTSSRLIRVSILILCLGLIAHTGRLDILLPHLRSMLTPGGRIILQATLTDHLGTRIVRVFTSRSEMARRGYRTSWFSQRNISDACDRAALRILETRRHSLGVPFGDPLWLWANLE